VADRFAPDVVVLDLMLPGLDGIEVCRELRRRSDCYVVMLTARSDEVDVLVGLGVGADDYLTKPFELRKLVLRLRALGRRRERVLKRARERPAEQRTAHEFWIGAHSGPVSASSGSK